MVIDEQQFRLCFEEFHSILTNEKGQFLLKRLPSTRLVESSGEYSESLLESSITMGTRQRIWKGIAKCLGKDDVGDDGDGDDYEKFMEGQLRSMENWEKCAYSHRYFYRLHIIPLNHRGFPMTTSTLPHSVLQRQHSGVSWNLFDSQICLPHFSDDEQQKCAIDYHPLNTRNGQFEKSLDRFLFGKENIVNMSDAFFIGAYAEYLVKELQRIEKEESYLDSLDLEILTTLLNHLDLALERGVSSLRYRLAGSDLLNSIQHFCQLDRNFLQEQLEEQFAKKKIVYFCIAREGARPICEKCQKGNYAKRVRMDTMRKRINNEKAAKLFGNLLNNEQKTMESDDLELVKLYMAHLSGQVRTINQLREMSDLDSELFGEISILLLNLLGSKTKSKGSGSKIDQIDGMSKWLAKICRNSNIFLDFQKANNDRKTPQFGEWSKLCEMFNPKK